MRLESASHLSEPAYGAVIQVCKSRDFTQIYDRAQLLILSE